MEQTIPVVDLSLFHGSEAEQAQCIREIGQGFHDIGFIAVKNHGISPELVQKSYRLAEQFFLLPHDAKAKYERVEQGEPRGFSEMGKEHVKDQVVPDLKEFWHTGRELMEDGTPQTLFPQNVWPDEVSGFRANFTRLYDELEMVACYILEAAAMHLGLPRYSMCDRVENGNSTLRLAHYPPVPEGTTPETFRSAPHEDIDFITLLCEATGNGLEILRKEGTWLPIRALSGQIIVNVGDMLQNLTNGYYKSTTHRVTNNNMDRNRRLSLPFFVHPRADVDLTPLKHLAPLGERNPKYRAITAGDYFMERLTEIGFGKGRAATEARPVA